MKLILSIIAIGALAGAIVPPVLYLAGSIPKDQVKLYMLIATILWFAVAPFCGRNDKNSEPVTDCADTPHQS